MKLFSHARKKRRGFTLIELLVVISIIALLIGILLPALASAKKAAQASQCLSSIRQFSIGMQSYAFDNKSNIYPTVAMGTGVAWYQRLDDGSYIDLTSGIHRCPNDTSSLWETDTRKTSYALNGYYASNHYPYYNVRLEDVLNPSKKINIAEIATERDRDHFMPMFWGVDSIFPGTGMMTPMMVRDNGEWDSTTNLPASIEMQRHQGAANYSFADGHGARHVFSDTWDIANTSISRTVDWYDPKYNY
jgi:prepilin-type N-terminal cleavage/methylation domain-containing protein/prepilin-type processing-associated H-X9-DG protein